ncbi:MAG TPA: 16S rRNA (cytosine(1402)-N(4))-methyltransferase [Planctomycetaceae bacterium]|nr:16S rRNA (cytosine(1402)-N(4))-methyltransferase [Planctomycetaceae bacterium]
MSSTIHVPVMASEVLQMGQPAEGQTWVDGTGGGGGHSQLLWRQLGTRGRLLIVDRDPLAVDRLRQHFPSEVQVRHARYDQVPELLEQLGWPAVDGVLLDLGLSSDQLADRERGFSFQWDGPLDMRFDPTEGQPAWQWLAKVDERTLADAIFQYGEERFSRRIARCVVERRRKEKLRTAAQLRELIYSCVPAGRPSKQGRKHGRVDPATRTFQALRIVVNQELSILDRAMRLLPNCLATGGRLMVISFHSLEDRIVKQALRSDPRLEQVTKKPVPASLQEISQNPRSRSAKLRVACRVEDLPS